ncbi:hypothetical protein LOTGIDRAFT_229801 [Lottia gigantea]|uniref:Acyl-CoA thioesterase II domain-containing protein n=1 Tax=Lottia gigantea TaxID=225164 RepID=V3ZF82_LOTGI|nr:hypothetical protein LOTGIDRAFT_229801 [Lottia gigantea]ESO82777.1 hypothetical protein LOTGIDRAFT_229801 [Lottia gigantea]
MVTTFGDLDLQRVLEKSFLNLEKIDTNIFRTKSKLWHPPTMQGIYGGQLVGQALAAASKTVSHTHHAHSLHCYYLNRGTCTNPVLYYIERTRDGNTYCSRNVDAKQDDTTLLTMQTSFKQGETDEYYHQFSMPITDKQPQDLLNVKQLYQIAVKNNYGSIKEREILKSLCHQDFPFEIRPVCSSYELPSIERKEAKRKYWIKAEGYLGEDSRIHQCAAAFLTDYLFVDVASIYNTDRHLQIVSLDHSIWFHNTFQANDWLLYDIESPQRGNGMAIATGRLWRKDGVLAMSVAQEGMMRPNPKL